MDLNCGCPKVCLRIMGPVGEAGNGAVTDGARSTGFQDFSLKGGMGAALLKTPDKLCAVSR